MLLQTCLGMQGPRPELLREPGVKLNTVQIRSQALMTLEHNNKPDRIFAFSDGGEDHRFRILTANGVTWFDQRFNKVKDIRFSKTKGHFPIIEANLMPGGTHFLGFHNLENVLTVYDGAGDFLFQVPASGGSGFPVTVLEKGCGFLVKGGYKEGVYLYDCRGNYIRTISSDGNTTSFRTVKRPEFGREDLIFFNYPYGKRRGYFQIAKLDGTLLQGWECEPGWSGFNLMELEGRTVIVGNPEQAFVCVDLKGNTVAKFDAPHADYFRYVHVAGLPEGYRVFMASGSGYRPFHMIWVYDAEENLIFQEFNRDRAQTLWVPDPAKAEFWVAAENRIRRYELPL